MVSDNVADRMALERATLGCCMYTATGGLLQVSNGKEKERKTRI